MYVSHFSASKNLPVLGIGVRAMNQDGFFNWFSTPVCPAHLVQKKEQSKESIRRGKNSVLANRPRRICGEVLTDVQNTGFLFFFYFPNISIQQSLLESTLSNLTTDDLEAREGKQRIVTPVGVQQALNTVKRGEESESATINS